MIEGEGDGDGADGEGGGGGSIAAFLDNPLSIALTELLAERPIWSKHAIKMAIDKRMKAQSPVIIKK